MSFPGSTYHHYRQLLGDDSYAGPSEPGTTLLVPHINDTDYRASNPLKSCAWMCGDKPPCKTPKFTDSCWCVVCGHEVDCHETVRVSL